VTYYLYKTIFLELEMISKNDVNAIAMAIMTFQYGPQFGFKRILLENVRLPPFFILRKVFYKYNGIFKQV
jgi:hypothetical protein